MLTILPAIIVSLVVAVYGMMVNGDEFSPVEMDEHLSSIESSMNNMNAGALC